MTENVTGFPLMKLATLDIDRTFVHWDNNKHKMDRLLADREDLLDNYFAQLNTDYSLNQ